MKYKVSLAIIVIAIIGIVFGIGSIIISNNNSNNGETGILSAIESLGDNIINDNVYSNKNTIDN